MRLATAFFKCAEHSPNQRALVLPEAEYTYAQLAAGVQQWIVYLTEWGLLPGAKLALMLPNGVSFIQVMLATAHLNGVLVPLSPSLRSQQVAHLLTQLGVQKIIAMPQAESAAAMVNCLQAVEVDCVLLETADSMPASRQVEHNKLPQLEKGAGECEAQSPYLLVMTSGSTGQPKPIVLSQALKYQRAQATLALYQVTAQQPIMAASPLYHSLGFRLALMALLFGNTLVLLPQFTVSSWYQCARAHQVAFTIVVAAQLQQIAAQYAKLPEYHLPDLQCLVSSSALLEVSYLQSLLHHWPGELHECYGTSETAIVTSKRWQLADMHRQSPASVANQPAAPSEEGAAGQRVGQAVTGVEVVILKPDASVARVGEVGEIACKSPLLFAGYYQQAALTQQSFWRGYFKTGDLGKLNSTGELVFLGRLKELINCGGINVFPMDIERAVALQASVAECAAFAYPHAQLGEVPAVAVVVKAGHSLTERQLRHHCVAQLADFQQPRHVFWVSAIPKNALGKPLKQGLKAELCHVQTP